MESPHVAFVARETENKKDQQCGIFKHLNSEEFCLWELCFTILFFIKTMTLGQVIELPWFKHSGGKKELAGFFRKLAVMLQIHYWVQRTSQRRREPLSSGLCLGHREEDCAWVGKQAATGFACPG